METSVARLLRHPGRLPGPPATRSDGDLGRSLPRPPWAPSRTSVQLLRWRPRSPVILAILAPSGPFVQPLRWRPRSPVSLAILGASQVLRLDGLKCARMRPFVPISSATSRPDLASVAPVNRVNKYVNKSIISRVIKPHPPRWGPRSQSPTSSLGTVQPLRPAAPMETSVAGDPPRPGHRPAPPSSCSDGDLGRRSPSPSWAPSGTSGWTD